MMGQSCGKAHAFLQNHLLRTRATRRLGTLVHHSRSLTRKRAMDWL